MLNVVTILVKEYDNIEKDRIDERKNTAIVPVVIHSVESDSILQQDDEEGTTLNCGKKYPSARKTLVEKTERAETEESKNLSSFISVLFPWVWWKGEELS